MAITGSYHKRVLGWVIVSLLVAAFILGGAQGVHANVVIKTQAAADNVPGGIRGIDVSKWQGTIKWDQVARDDVNFAMIRASYGMELDETFYRNATEAHAAGLKVGSYHYAKFKDYASMLAEAELFISQLKQVNITYPAVLDVEATRNLSKNELARLCALFLEEVRSAGYDVMFYTYENFLDPYLNMNYLSDYKLWIANYLREPNRNQAMWQHTSYGSVMGISGRVDINIAYENLAPSAGASGDVLYVNSDVSRSIKETLNDRYYVGLPLDSLDMDEMNRAIAIGLQEEVNRQFGVELPIYDYVGDQSLENLQSINYTPGQTKGNITYLIQVKLFYKGHYEGYPTGEYDDNTVQALRNYQYSVDIGGNGLLNPETVRMLLG